MRVKIDTKEKKIIVLRWLQNGVVDTSELPAEKPETLTEEELEKKLIELNRKLDICETLRKYKCCNKEYINN